MSFVNAAVDEFEEDDATEDTLELEVPLTGSRYSQRFMVLGNGSPNVAVLQVMLPLAVRLAHCPLAPKRISFVPLNKHV